jgi:hypothetical protein
VATAKNGATRKAMMVKARMMDWLPSFGGELFLNKEEDLVNG